MFGGGLLATIYIVHAEVAPTAYIYYRRCIRYDLAIAHIFLSVPPQEQ